MAELRPPFRAEHVGSFPRPEALMDAREAFSQGKLDRAGLTRIEDAAVRDVVAMQERVGIGAITDGEYRKGGWRDFLFEKVEGFGEPVLQDFTFTQFDGTPWKPFGAERTAMAKLRRAQPITADDFAALKPLTGRPVKANLPTPSVAHAFSGERSFDHAVYPDRDAYLADLARIYREEIADLAARGCKYLQLDEVPLALLCDPKNQDMVRARGDDPKALIEAYIDVINDCVRDAPDDMAIGVHMCRGNVGHGMASGGYEPIAERMFSRLNVDGFFLEYDTPRAGDFAPLRFLPPPKKAVLGLLTTKLPEIEFGRFAEAARRRSRKIRGARPALPVAAMRLCQRRPTRRPPDDGHRGTQTCARRGRGAPDLGIVRMAEKPPFRAEHVGSFPRPEPLIKARDEFAAGKIDLAALRKVEDVAVREVVAMQERVGIGAVTDGEFRRTSWRDAPFEHFAGFTEKREESDFTFRLFDGTTRKAGPVPSVVAKLTRASPLTADTFALLKPMTKGLPKANLPTPSVTHFFRGRAQIDKSIYPDLEGYFADVTRLYREEVADLAKAGCKYLQMDEVPLALLCDPNIKGIVKGRGEDPDRIIDFYIAAINDSIRDRPKDMAIAVHMCRGNQGHGMSDSGYEPLADKLFNQLEVDGFFLEFDTPRAGDFAPLRFLPKGRKAALGLVSTKLPEVESADSLEARIAEAAKSAPIDRLCLCPQCGFSSNAGTGRFTPAAVEAKLARIVEVAHKVWG